MRIACFVVKGRVFLLLGRCGGRGAWGWIRVCFLTLWVFWGVVWKAEMDLRKSLLWLSGDVEVLMEEGRKPRVVTSMDFQNTDATLSLGCRASLDSGFPP